jgi:hypothetical protein
MFAAAMRVRAIVGTLAIGVTESLLKLPDSNLGFLKDGDGLESDFLKKDG